MKNILIPVTLPQWFRNMPLNGMCNAKEVAELFNYSCTESLWASVHGKYFPEPTIRNGFGDGKSHYKGSWSKKCILQEICRRNSQKETKDGEV